MNIFTVSAFALLACSAAVILKRFSDPIAPLVSTAAAVMIVSAAIVSLTPVIDFIKELEGGQGYDSYYSVMLKGLGIAVLSESASDICRDCGEASIASKVELAAKVSMLILSLPLLNTLVSLSKEMMSG